MKALKRVAIVLAGIAAVIMVAVIAAPRAVHAVAATLVEVMNPSSSPVQTREVNNGVDELFGIALCSGTDDNCGIGEVEGGFPLDSGSSFTVPNTDAQGNAIQALVINYVSGVCPSPNPGLMRQSAVDTVNGQSQIINFFIATNSSTSGSSPTISQPVYMVVPANSTISVYPPNASGGCYLTVNGYYVAKTSTPL